MSTDDIIADLAPAGRRAPGYPCVIHGLRRADPALAAQFDRVIEAKRKRTLDSPYRDIAAWFTAKGVQMSENMVGIHVRDDCNTCKRAAS